MKVFLCSFLGLVLLFSSVHARFAHSKQYLERLAKEQDLRNRLTMEQSWAKRISHARINSNSGTGQPCSLVMPQPGFGTDVESAVTVCNIDGTLCHHTQLFRCCEEENLLGEDANIVPGGATVDFGNGKTATVSFFYSGGGYGSRQPLSLCYTIEGSNKLCDGKAFGCDPSSSCGPNDDICEGNIVEGTCNPDPNPDNGGGCTCQEGYLRPNCCLCDFPDFYQQPTGVGEFTCEKLCRENCVGAPTTFGCSRCEEGYQGRGCCECAPGYITSFGKCVPVCESKCAAGKFNPVTGCSECLPGYQAPTCCQCDHHYLKVGDECKKVCDQNCVRNHYTYTHGCTHCKEGYGPTPLCCDCADGFFEEDGECVDNVCEQNCLLGTYDPDVGCGQCKVGYVTAPKCCDCDTGLVKDENGQCHRPGVCESNCVTGTFDPITGCGQCKPGYQGAPECCECAEGFSRNADGDCVREVCDAKCTGTFNPLTGCSSCQLGYAPPTCCDCVFPPFVKDGTECRPACPTNCQEGFFTDGVGCAENRCREGHQASPLCCNCTEGFMQPFPGAPCTRIPTCEEDERLENGECVPICKDDEVYDPETGECNPACGGNEDLVFLLDYSTSFQPGDLRGIIGNLQLLSNAFDFRPNIRDAAIHYNIRPSRIDPNRGFIASDYIYDYDTTCTNTVPQLDRFAGSGYIDNQRSFTTESYSALNFVSEKVPFTAGRRTSVVAITDGFSDASDRITRIETEIDEIKRKASDANARARFFSIGIRSQNVPDLTNIRAELKALADGDDRTDTFVFYEQFTNTLLNLLVNATILCPSDRDAINKTLTEDNGSNLRDYIYCTQHESTIRSCATDELEISCTTARTMERRLGRKGSLMTEILAAVQSVFNDAFKTE